MKPDCLAYVLFGDTKGELWLRHNKYVPVVKECSGENCPGNFIQWELNGEETEEEDSFDEPCKVCATSKKELILLKCNSKKGNLAPNELRKMRLTWSRANQKITNNSHLATSLLQAYRNKIDPDVVRHIFGF